MSTESSKEKSEEPAEEPKPSATTERKIIIAMVPRPKKPTGRTKSS